MKNYNKSLCHHLDIHLLHTLPTNCVNRDDVNAPKTCNIGGTVRSYVSSQCWKKAMKDYMAKMYGDDGKRTKSICSIIAERLVGSTGFEYERVLTFVTGWLSAAGIANKDKKESSAFFSMRQIDRLTGLLEGRAQTENFEKESVPAKKDKNGDDKEGSESGVFKKSDEFARALRDAACANPSVSQILAGRMFASLPEGNYGAACMVAPAMTVNEAPVQSDFYTTVSDMIDGKKPHGSDYLDYKYNTSGTYYRYASMNFSEGTDIRKAEYGINMEEAVTMFLDSFIRSMPSGSVNGYGNVTLPDTILIQIRDDQPVSFSDAFLSPVKSKDGEDIHVAAQKRMLDYDRSLTACYGGPVKEWLVSLKDESGFVVPSVSLDEVIAQVAGEVKKIIDGEM